MVHLHLSVLHVAWLSSYAQVSVNDTRTELDSNADTTAMGSSTALFLHDYEQPVHIHIFLLTLLLMTTATLSLQQSPMSTQRKGSHTWWLSIKQFSSTTSQQLLYHPCSYKTLESVLMVSLGSWL